MCVRLGAVKKDSQFRDGLWVWGWDASGNVYDQPGAWALEKSLKRLSFFCIFEKSGINKAIDLAVSQLWGSTIAIISADVPGLHMWASAGPGPTSSSSKQWKSDGCFKICNSVSARSPLTKSKKNNYRECSNIKSALVNALTGSVPHKLS